jgi:hypothetical protein
MLMRNCSGDAKQNQFRSAARFEPLLPVPPSPPARRSQHKRERESVSHFPQMQFACVCDQGRHEIRKKLLLQTNEKYAFCYLHFATWIRHLFSSHFHYFHTNFHPRVYGFFKTIIYTVAFILLNETIRFYYIANTF